MLPNGPRSATGEPPCQGLAKLAAMWRASALHRDSGYEFRLGSTPNSSGERGDLRTWSVRRLARSAVAVYLVAQLGIKDASSRPEKEHLRREAAAFADPFAQRGG
jgi:hypothetical protein